MKIAVYHNQPSGGARRALHGFCKELGMRHKLSVYSLTTADQEMLRDESLTASVIRFPYARHKPIRGGLYLNDLFRRLDLANLEASNREIAAHIDAGGYNVVLVDACRFTFVPYVLRFLKTPTVYYCHHRPRGFHEKPASTPGSVYEKARRLWHRPIERTLERKIWRDDLALVRMASKVVTNSAFNRARIEEIYDVRAAICPPGVGLPERDASGAGAKSDYVLSVGELETRKGHDLVIRSLGLLPSELRPPLHLVANGGNPAVRAELDLLARASGVELIVRVLPPQDDLAAEYWGASIFLYGARQEPLGLAPLEAMAHRVPVVAVAEGGPLETVQDGKTGYLVRRDAREFAARVGSLLTDASMRAEMGRAAREAVEARWTWPQRADALERELESVARPTA